MTKIRSSLLILLLSNPLFALANRIGNEMPASSDGGHFCSWRFGVFARFIQNDMLDVRRNHASVHKSSCNTILSEVTLNLFDRIDLHGGIGTSKLNAETNTSTLYQSGTHRNNLLDLNFTTAFAWSVGANAKCFEWRNWYSGLGMSYFSHRPQLEYVLDSFNAVSHYTKLDAHYYTWMLTLGGGYLAQISHTFSLSPHMAAIYGPLAVDISNSQLALGNATTVEISELYVPYMWGYVLGVTLTGSDCFSLTAQMGRIMYHGFSISGSIPF